jgi:hypothetical protein
MSSRALLLGLVALPMAFAVSCAYPPMEHPKEYATIPGIHAGQAPEDVIKVLGHPQARENGWWVQSVWFDMEFNVWYYKKVGRVIFDRRMAVYTSEADGEQLGRAESPEPAERFRER